LEEVLRLIEEERTANKSKNYIVDRDTIAQPNIPDPLNLPVPEIKDPLNYRKWLATNVFEQKQKGFYGVYIKVTTGDLSTKKAREFVNVIKDLVANEIRVTQNQGLLLKYVRPEVLIQLYAGLASLGLAEPGFDSVADVTTCPGTDTCNLGISNSTELSRVLENVIYEEYEDLVYNRDIKIKISGCMNSCGQHGLAHIGFHGSSLKANGRVVPAVQVLLGGGVLGDGAGRAAEKIVKVPSKRATIVLRIVLDDYHDHSQAEELFNEYYDRRGKDYFYQLLKPIADTTTLKDQDYVDWGHEEVFKTAIGVGECAGVMIDLVATLLLETEEKLEWAMESFENGAFADSIYHTYSVFVNAAKALLLDKGINSSTHTGIIRDFDEHYKEAGFFETGSTFSDLVLQINKNEPSQDFAAEYLQASTEFIKKAKAVRETLISL
jgi:sulfite reductase (ferredoxin)